jgi:hypothetical protein
VIGSLNLLRTLKLASKIKEEVPKHFDMRA